MYIKSFIIIKVTVKKVEPKNAWATKIVTKTDTNLDGQKVN